LVVCNRSARCRAAWPCPSPCIITRPGRKQKVFPPYPGRWLGVVGSQ
jgi:hypothetical protein